MMVCGYGFGQIPNNKLCPSGINSSVGQFVFCGGDSINIYYNPGTPNNHTFYQWMTGNYPVLVPIVGATNSSLNVKTSGNFYLRVIDTLGIDDTCYRVQNITVNPKPNANFTFTPTTGCGRTFVQITNGFDTTTNLQYQWNMGDPTGFNNTPNTINPSHIYVPLGTGVSQTYTIKLTLVASNTGCTSQSIKTITINSGADATLAVSGSGISPITNASAIAVGYKICSPVNSAVFNFSNQSSTLATNSQYQIIWGDGSPDFSSSNFSSSIPHNYSVGLYNLKFSVTALNGCVNTTTYSIFLGTNPAVSMGSPGNTDVCAPATLTFPIDTSVANKNPPGTIYTVHFNDGSNDTTFNHPPPISVTHTFFNASCGVSSPIGGANSFYASITASNPCKITSGYVSGITVTKKPKMSFSIKPSDIVCVNTTVTLTNTGSITTVPFSNSTCSSGNLVWKISPSTGWSLSSGAMGDDIGSPNAVDWISGDKMISVYFYAAGNYTITLKGGGTTCLSDSSVNTICVIPVPVSSFTLSKNSICINDTATAISTTSSSLCGMTTYKWAVSYSPLNGCSPDTSLFLYTQATDTFSANPHFKFVSPGIYSISLVTSVVGTDCVSNVFTDNITVKGKPRITVNAIGNVCKGDTINPTYTTPVCNIASANYQWTFEGGNPASINSLNPGKIKMDTAGIKTISLTATNDCGTLTSSTTVSVLTPPIFTATPSSSSICNGQSFSINLNSLSSGIKYTWVSSATGAITGNSNQSSKISTNTITDNLSTTSLTPITVTYNVTIYGADPENCVGETKQIVVNLIPGVSIANAGQNQILCSQNSVALAGNLPSVGVGVWKKVSGPSGETITDTLLNNTTVTGLNVGIYTFQWSISGAGGSCPSSSSTVQIINHPQVTTANAGTDILKCDWGVVNTLQLNGNSNPARIYETVTWNFISAANGATINNINAPNAVITFANVGTYQLTWTIRNDATTIDSSCKKSVDTINIIVKEFPTAGTINGTNEICKGSNGGALSLTGNTLSANIQWQISNDNIIYTDIATANTSTYNVGILNATTWYKVWYKVKVYQTSCNDTISSNIFKIQVDSISKAGTITPALQEVCTNSGNVNLLMQNNVGSNINWIYNINNTGYNSFTPTLSTNSIVVNNSPFIQNTTTQIKIIDIKAIVISGVCPADTSIVATIKVYPNTETAVAGSQQNLCFQPSTILQATTPINGVGTWSQLSGPNTATFADTANPQSTLSNLIVGSYLLKWKLSGSTNNICQPSFDTVRINNYDTIINKIKSTADTLCSNQTLQINSFATVAGGDGNYTYQWQQSIDGINWTNITTNGTQETYSTTAATTLYFRRNIISSTCTSASNIIIIIVQPGLGNNTISANQNTCINTTPNLLNGALPTGGSSVYQYQWQQLNNGVWINILNETNINYQPPLTTILGDTSFRRIVSSGFCNGDISNTVTISTKPDSKAFYTFKNDKLCTSAFIDTANIQAQDLPLSNGTYEWYANNILIGTGILFPGYTIINNGDTVYIKLKTISPYGCKSDSFEHKFYTVQTPTVSFAKSINKGCGPLTVSFTNTTTPLNAPTYKWNFGNGQTSTLQQPTNIVFSDDTSKLRHDTTYYVTLTAFTQCDSIVYKDSVTVLPKPKALFQPDTTVGCSIFHFKAFNNSLGTHCTYFWDYGDSSYSSDTSGGYVYHDFKTNKTDTFSVKLKAVNVCGADSGIVKIVVFPNTIVPKLIVDGSSNYGCAPQQIRLVNNTIGANKFTINFGDGSLPYLSNKNPDTVYHIYQTGGTFTATMKAENGCTDSTVSLALIFYNKPTANFSTTFNQYCKKETIQFKNLSDSTLSFEWWFGDGGTSTNLHPIHRYLNAGNYTITLIAKSTNPTGAVCTDTIRKTITVHDLPISSFTNNAAVQNCQPYYFIGVTNLLPSEIANWAFSDSFSNDTTQAGNVGVHTFKQAGIYKVQLVTINVYGCTDTSSTNVKVIETPKVAFAMSDTISCIPGKSVTCTNQTTYSSADAVNYQWYINGVLQATTKDLNYNFNVPVTITVAANFVVKLVAINSYGCRDSATKLFVIYPKAQPSFAMNAAVGCVPFNLQFNNTTKYANLFNWYLDGQLFSTSAVPNPIVLSIPATSYNIKLVANHTLGCGADSITKQFTTYTKPVADFLIPNKNSCTGILNIQCFDLSSVVGANITKWNWIFGDGATDTLKNPTHTYTIAGHFNVGLVATDNRGCKSDITYQRVANFGKPKANFSVGNVCVKNPLLPVNLSTPGLGSTAITNYLWNFGDGNYLTGSQPIYVYQNEGNYILTLIVTSDSSCVADTMMKTVTVYGKPTADFKFENNCIKENTLFTNTSSYGFGQTAIGNSKWTFGDGGISNNFNAAHIFNATGDYVVQLAVSGNRCPNLTDSIKKVVTVHKPRDPVIYPRIEGVRGTPIQLYALTGGVQYNWIPITGLDNAGIQNPIGNYNVSHPNIISYTISITDSLGCKVKDKQEIWLFADADIFVPTAFTPNGDGANDILKPLYVNIAKVNYFRIFDRWGKVVFETSDMGKAWDGTLNGSNLPMETYSWMISAITQQGKESVKKGNTTLIRN